MEMIPPPAPRRKNRVVVWLSDDHAEMLNSRAAERGERPGEFASKIMARELPRYAAPATAPAGGAQ